MGRAKTTAAATAVAVVAAGLLSVAPAQATGQGCAGPATQPPSPNTWYDPNGNYRGTRVGGNYAIQVYETFGHDFYRVETWDRFYGGTYRVACEEQPHQPRPVEPPQQPVHGGGGGEAVGVYVPRGNVTIFFSDGGIRQGRVTVGPPAQIRPE